MMSEPTEYPRINAAESFNTEKWVGYHCFINYALILLSSPYTEISLGEKNRLK